MLFRDKRAQIAIFAIIAILLVAAIALLFYLKPELRSMGAELHPIAYIENCMRENAEVAIGMLGNQGGNLNPTGFVSYNSNRVAYLCYTTSYYSKCVNQDPLLKYSVESEITGYVYPKLQACLSNLKRSYEKKGYSVDMGPQLIETSLQPKKVVVSLGMPLTLQKSGGETKRYENFEAVLLSPIYDQVMLAQEIANSETRYGDFDQLTYMLYKPSTDIEKKSQGEATIYILTDRNSGKKFQFAIRSYIMPPGF